MKKLLIAAVALVALLVAGAYALPREVVVMEATQVSASPDVLFELLSTPREWRAWAPWTRDANLKGTVGGPPTGVGARWDWSSDAEPGGWLVFTRAIPSATMSFDLRSERFGGLTTSVVQLAPNNQGTVVQWQLTANLGNSPVQRWLGVRRPAQLRREMAQAMAALETFSRDLPPSEPIMGREMPQPNATPNE